jgi:hypothetical protein
MDMLSTNSGEPLWLSVIGCLAWVLICMLAYIAL